MKYKKIIVSLLIILFIVIAFYSLIGVMTPYVSFKEAIDTGKYVQIIGKLNKSAPQLHEEGSFTFTLNDEDNNLIKIDYKGVKPLNFEHANQIVALGTYNRQKRIFEAEKILIKCPSKYIKEKE